MADQVHPTDSPQGNGAEAKEKKQLLPISRPHSSPPPGTYVVLIPKDQILRPAPPPRGIAKRHARRRRNCCYCCFCWLLSLIILAAAAVGLFFLIYRPKALKYSVEKISINGFNLTSSSTGQSLSPKMDVTVRAQNPNNKIGFYYRKGSSIVVTHSDNAELCRGVLPVFYHPTKNVTIIQMALKASSGLKLSSGDLDTFMEQQRKREIPLRLNLKVPVKIKIGFIKTWTIEVKGHCDITVDELTNNATIVSNKCDIGVKPWG